MWRNWIARGTSNPKVRGSIPRMGSLLLIIIRFYTLLSYTLLSHTLLSHTRKPVFTVPFIYTRKFTK